mgnify:FL=1
MKLLDHISITVRDLSASKRFYKAICRAFVAVVAYEREDAIGFGERNSPDDNAHTYLSVFQSGEASSDQRRHWCFRANSEEQVRSFHATGLVTGGTDDGKPGLRAYHSGYFAAFLMDPEGNKIEAVFHQGGA